MRLSMSLIAMLLVFDKLITFSEISSFKPSICDSIRSSFGFDFTDCALNPIASSFSVLSRIMKFISSWSRMPTAVGTITL